MSEEKILKITSPTISPMQRLYFNRYLPELLLSDTKPMSCALIAAPLYPTMTMNDNQPDPETCAQGIARGFESCLRCEHGKK